jgi:zinc finger protein
VRALPAQHWRSRHLTLTCFPYSVWTERGSTYTVHIRTPADLSRQIVKSPTSTITIPEFSLTIPPGKGQLTNVEGVVRDTYRDLELDQPVRKIMDPETHAKIETLLNQLRAAVGDEVEEDGARTWEGRNRGEVAEDVEGRPEQTDVKRRRTSDAGPTEPAATAEPAAFVPFTLTLDDPSGNSFAAFHETISDPKWSLRTYVRSRAQDEALGLVAPREEGAVDEDEYVDAGEGRFENEEVYSFPSTCSSCQGALDTLMKKVNIPYFQVRPCASSICLHRFAVREPLS